MSDREPNDIVQLKLRYPERLRARLAAAAERNGTSLNGEITSRLEESVRNEDDLGGSATARALRELAAEVAHAERATGKSWLEDEATFMAASTLIRERLGRMRPHPVNFDDLLVINKRREEADNAVLASLKYLERIGVVRRVGEKTNALLRFVRSYERPNLFGRTGALPPIEPKSVRYADETEEEHALHEGLLNFEYELAVDIRADPATWILEDRGRPLPDDEKERIKAITLHLPTMFAEARAAEAEFEAAWQPSIEAAQRGQEIARQLRALEQRQSEGANNGPEV